MVNLRELCEADLAQTLEGDFGLPIILIAPDGSSETVQGQILYDTIIEDPNSGSEIIVHKPVATVRRSTLSRIPVEGERWSVRIPTTPSTTATPETFLLERPSEDGGSIGFIRLYLVKAEQS